ncbi:MAG: PPOX class F420-dependent oxidoreductase [Anaerolineae bacterium]
MSSQIPEAFMYLLEQPVLASLATLMPDGRPQVNPVWCDFDGTYVRVNSVAGRQKDKNLNERKFATLLLVDPGNPYRWLEIRGRVAGITAEGGVAHIDSLAKKYTGQDTFTGRIESDTRVIYNIIPERVVTHSE